jgi:hypothetical protein
VLLASQVSHTEVPATVIGKNVSWDVLEENIGFAKSKEGLTYI